MMAELIEFPAQLIAGLRGEVDGASIAELFTQAVAQVTAHLPQDLVAGPLTQVVHRDDGDHFDVTIGLPVSADPGAPELTLTRVPGGPALREIHIGEYAGLRDAYARIDAALLELHATRYTAIERYLTGPSDNPDPDTWRTEIIVPISDE